MLEYVRPSFEAPEFRDAAGEIIDYGNRWGIDGPPGEAYSVVSHSERYAPLHPVAEVLISYLVENYVVDVVNDLSVVADLDVTYEGEVDRAVRVTPRDATKAPLTFVLTHYPGVLLHVGVLQDFDNGYDFAFPACGCDACDESPECLVEDLEQRAFAVSRSWDKKPR